MQAFTREAIPMNRAERRRQQRAQRNFTAPSDRELLELLSERGGTPVTDGREGLLRVIPDLVRSDLDDAEDVLRTAAVCYPGAPEVLLCWALVHEALGHENLSASLAHEFGEHPLLRQRPFDSRLAFQEQARFAHRRGDYAAVLEVCSHWQQQAPEEVEPESLAQFAAFMQGQHQQALRASQKLWQQRPDSFLAGFRTFQLLTLIGQTREARAMVEGLRNWSGSPDREVQAEFLMWIAGDEEMAALWKSLRTKKALTPLLRHYGAVSLSRRGQWAEARKQWGKALEEDPSLRVARENLEQAGPEQPAWPYTLWQWLPMTVVAQLMSHPESPLDRLPELLWRLPFLWERGGPMGRSMALNTALNDPEHRCGLLLARFVQGRHGWGLLWGAELPEFEVHGEPHVNADPARNVLFDEALSHRQRGRWEQAKEIYSRLLETEPKDPIALNNLATCLEELGDPAGSQRILHENFAANPDYLFARLAIAEGMLREQRLQEAQETLAPLLQRRRFHLSEFKGLCDVMLKLALFGKDHEACELWMQAWEEGTARFGRNADAFRPPTYALTLRLRRELQSSLQRSMARLQPQ